MNRERGASLRWLTLPALIAVGCAVVGPPAAHSATTVLNGNIDLVGTQPFVTTWNPSYGSGDLITDAYTPVDGGSLYRPDGNTMGDAFDGGLMLQVGGADYNPENSAGETIGNVFHSAFGQGVKTPARTLAGVRVSRIDVVRANRSATLRSLVKLTNPSGQNRTLDVVLESNLDSDVLTALRRTSTGDAVHTPADRWLVSSDDATDPNDAVVTHVLYGKRARRKVTMVNSVLGDAGGDEMSVTLGNVRVPKQSIRYLLFFAEISAGNQAAINGAAKFNRPQTVRPLLQGVSKRVRKNVVNWQLVRRKR